MSPTERGAILYVGVANVEFKKDEPVDRFIALFTKYIMFFEVSRDMTYDIKEKFPVSGFTVRRKDVAEVVFGTSCNFDSQFQTFFI